VPVKPRLQQVVANSSGGRQRAGATRDHAGDNARRDSPTSHNGATRSSISTSPVRPDPCSDRIPANPTSVKESVMMLYQRNQYGLALDDAWFRGS